MKILPSSYVKHCYWIIEIFELGCLKFLLSERRDPIDTAVGIEERKIQ